MSEVDQILSKYASAPASRKRKNVRQREAVRVVAPTPKPAQEVVKAVEPKIVVVQFQDGRCFLNGTNDEVQIEQRLVGDLWYWCVKHEPVTMVTCNRYGKIGERLVIDGDKAHWEKAPSRPPTAEEKIKAMPGLPPIEPAPPEPKSRSRFANYKTPPRWGCYTCSPGHRGPDCVGACEEWGRN